MRRNPWVVAALATLLATAALPASAQQTYKQLPVNNPAFLNITEAYSTTLKRQKELRPEVWVSSHAGHFNLHQKYKPGDKYDPNRFIDPDGFQAKIQFYEKHLQCSVGT